MTIEAKLRITPLFDAVFSALSQLKREVQSVNGGTAAPSGGTSPLKPLSDGAARLGAQLLALRKQLDAVTTSPAGGAGQGDGGAPLALLTERAKALGAQLLALRQRLGGFQGASDDAGKSVKLTANEMRQLSPQITDIVTGLANGQSVLQVFTQQGGQVVDVLGGMGRAMTVLRSLLTPLNIGLGLMVGAIATVAVQALQGSRQSAELRRQLALTGEAAGQTADQVGHLAETIAAEQQVSINSVRETLISLVATGQYVDSTLGAAGRAITAISKLSGRSAEEVQKELDGLSTNVAAGALQLNRSYNFLTATQYEYIRSLEAQGRSQEAMRVALNELSSTIEGRTAHSLGTLQRLWLAVGKAVSDTLDKMRAIGRDETPEQALEKSIQSLTARLLELEQLKARGGRIAIGVGQGETQNQIDQVSADLNEAKRELARIRQRAADKSAAQQEENQKLLEASKQYQDALAEVDLAGTQKLLAQQEGFLDQRQALVERSYANGLLSARDQALQLNAIDQQRLAAQKAALERQLQIEQARVTEKPVDELAKQAKVSQIEAQLLGLEAKLRQAGTEGRTIVEADALNTARDNATAWAQIWQQAMQQVRQLAQQNAGARALRETDPQARADAEAAAKVAELRQQAADLERDLTLRISLAVDPAQKAALETQLKALARESQAAIDEQARQARVASFQAQLADLQQALQLQEQAIDAEVERGAITTSDGERKKFAARAQAIPQLERILQLQQQIAATPAERNDAQGAKQQIDVLKFQQTELEKVLRTSTQNGFSQFLVDITTKTKKAKEAVQDFALSVARSLLDLIAKRLGEQLVDSLFPSGGSGGSAGANGGSGSNGFWAAAAQFIASQFHSGGIVGAGGTARSMPLAAFAYAPRYHSGGIAGLAPNEVPAVLQVGEEVLTKDDPRHMNNLRSGIGDVSISVQVQGAQGDNGQLQGAGTALARVVRTSIEQWAAEQSRQGGVLARG